MTYNTLYRNTIMLLKKAGNEAPAFDTMCLFEDILGMNRHRLIVDGNRVGIIVEPGTINVEWNEKIIARGTPLNDKLNIVNNEIDALEADWEKLSTDLSNQTIDEQEAEKRNKEASQ